MRKIRLLLHVGRRPMDHFNETTSLGGFGSSSAPPVMNPATSRRTPVNAAEKGTTKPQRMLTWLA
ncbi:MAG TPA: hypothetical protein DDW89_08660, partial [Gammaproteobacteria bacterium]|nr:hypothetical protein [Gammaproteobacteria bacterium]